MVSIEVRRHLFVKSIQLWLIFIQEILGHTSELRFLEICRIPSVAFPLTQIILFFFLLMAFLKKTNGMVEVDTVCVSVTAL